MLVIVNTDNKVRAGEEVAQCLEAELRSQLGRYESAITRAEVHLGDANAGKHGADDKRCAIALRLEHRPPEIVVNTAPSYLEAWRGALAKAERVLEHMDGRLGEPRREAARRRPRKREAPDGLDA